MDPSQLAQMQQMQQMQQPAQPVGEKDREADLEQFIDMNKAAVLNANRGCDLKLILKENVADIRLFSDEDVDEQLLITIPFTQLVKIKRVCIRANNKGSADSISGPKIVKLFINNINLDFNEAEDSKPTQLLDLDEKQIDGEQIDINFLKFQRVDSITVFVETNQDDADVTFLNQLSFYGMPIADFNMNNLKKSG